MDRLAAMQRFIRVAELGSFTGAADSLGLPKASVSAAVQWLENRLNTRLLQRSTRRVSLTHDGQVCLEHCRSLLADVEALESRFQRNPEEITGTLRVDMPSRFASNVVIPHLPEFFRRHPKLSLELSSADRQVDVISEGFDCVIRAGTLRDSSLIARPLTAFTLLNCASPAYLEQFGEPKTPADLQRHRLIHYSTLLGTRPEGFEYVDNKRKVHTLEMQGAITVNGTDAYLAACLAGFGIAQIPEIGVLELLNQGKLISILPKHRAEPLPVNMVYSSRRNPSRRVRAFMDWMDEVVKLVKGEH